MRVGGTGVRVGPVSVGVRGATVEVLKGVRVGATVLVGTRVLVGTLLGTTVLVNGLWIGSVAVPSSVRVGTGV